MPADGPPRPVRRGAPRVLRRARRARRGDALPPPRHGGPRGPRRAARRGGEHYTARGGRSPINDLNRDLLARLRGELERRGIDRRSSGATATPSRSSRTPCGRRSTSAPPGSSRSSRVPTPATPRAASTARTSRPPSPSWARRPTASSSTRCGRMPCTPVGRSWLRALVAALRSLPDPSTARILYVTHSVPEAMDDTSGPGDGEGNLYSDQHVRSRGGSPTRSTGSSAPPCPASSSSAPDRVLRPSPGWSRTSTTASWSSRARVAAPSSSRRSGSCPTTWRWSTTSTPRPPRRLRASGSPSSGADPRHRRGVRRGPRRPAPGAGGGGPR